MASATTRLYGGALSDPEHAVLIMGIDGNLVSFTIAALFQLVGTWKVWRTGL